MIPYARGLILDNYNNYGIVQTETVFGFVPQKRQSFFNNSFNDTAPMEWVLSQGSFERPLLDSETTSRSLKVIPKVITKNQKKSKEKLKKTLRKSSKEKTKKNTKKHSEKIKRQSKGVKKCIFKIFKKGEKNNKRKGSRQKMKMGKKYMMPIILGLLAAKSLLIPVILKLLAFISAKGLAMGFFSTILASVLSLKNVFDHNHYQSRKDDAKTQVEIIQVPSKNDEHQHFYDDFKRGDYVAYVPTHKYDYGLQNNRI